jgi:uncharacterized protein YdhG (YjbR/CyaY superfamily)
MENKKPRFTTIDEYIALFPEDTQKILQEVRATIKATAPEAKETIKYLMPTFTLKGNLVYFACWKNHIGFYPPISDSAPFKAELARYEGEKGAIRFPLNEPMPLDLITRMVKFRIQEDLAYAEAKSHKSDKAN